ILNLFTHNIHLKNSFLTAQLYHSIILKILSKNCDIIKAVIILKKEFLHNKGDNLMRAFDTLFNPYHSQRNPVVSKKGMVATSQPLAAQAGLTIMQNGGNAIDAAIATAAALTVVEPTTNGIGGDAFA